VKVPNPLGKWSDALARRATRRDVGGWLLRGFLGAGIALFGGGADFDRRRRRKCQHLKGGCGKCGWWKDGCGGFPRCEDRGYQCQGEGLECPDECQYTTYWACCCQGAVIRCIDCRCGRKICICRGETGATCGDEWENRG
jgi:hypothetical protein